MPIPDAPVGIYGDMLFNGFVALSIGLGGNPAAGVLAQSPPNIIGYGALSQLDNPQGQPAMTVVYPDTTVQYFDLTSFFFGWVPFFCFSSADWEVRRGYWWDWTDVPAYE